MKLNVKKSQLVRIGRSHNKAVHGVLLNGRPIARVNELKYSTYDSTFCPHHMRVRFFQCFNSIYAQIHCFSEAVMQHFVNVHCKPYDTIRLRDAILTCARKPT